MVKAWGWSESSNSCAQICRLRKRLGLSILRRKEISKVKVDELENGVVDHDSGKADTANNASVLFWGAMLRGDEFCHSHGY